MPSRIVKFAGDLFRGPDGSTWAIGRFYSMPVVATGLWVIVDTHLHNRAAPDMVGLGIGLSGVAASALMFITGTKNVDTPGVGFMERMLPQPVSQVIRP